MFVRASLPILACVLLTSGCAPRAVWAETWKPDRKLYVKSPERVEVFTSGTPARPHKELGIIEIKGGGKLSDLVAEMREFAGGRGCDALIVIGSAYDSYGVRIYRGSCVLYTGAAKQAAASPPSAAPERVCAPNATQLCHGPGACQGAQSCLSDGTGYTPCDCGASPAPAAEAAP